MNAVGKAGGFIIKYQVQIELILFDSGCRSCVFSGQGGYKCREEAAASVTDQ